MDALDDWAVYEPDAPTRDTLLAINRLADPGPWLDRFRDPAVRADKEQFARLAEEVATLRLRPAVYEAAHEHQRRAGWDFGKLIEPVLASSLRHPGSFRLNFTLAQWYSEVRPELGWGYFQAARVIRPNSRIVGMNMVVLLDKWNPKGKEMFLRELQREFAGSPAVQIVIGGKALQMEKNDLALLAARQAVEANPRNADAQAFLGQVLALTGDHAAAIGPAREAVRLDPGSSDSWIALAAALAGGSEAGWEEGIAAARRATELKPNFGATWFYLGLLLQKTGEGPGATAAYRKAAELNPTTYGRLAKVLIRTPAPPPRELTSPRALARNANAAGLAVLAANPGAAEAHFRDALRIDPELAAAHANLAVVLNNQKKWAEAIPVAREAIRLNPTIELGHYALGYALYQRKEYKEAVPPLREAVRIKPADAANHAYLGRALLELGETSGAERALVEAARLDSARYGQLPALVGKIAVAPPPWAVVAVDRSSAASLAGYAKALRERGQNERAAAASRAAIVLEPKKASYHNDLGVALHADKDYTAAEASFREAARLEPTLALAHSNLGIALRLQKKYPEAISAAREALKLNPKSAIAHATPGLSLKAVGEFESAKPALAEAARLDPKAYGKLIAVEMAPPPRDVNRP